MILLSVLSSCIDAFLFGISFGLQKIRVTWIEALWSSFFPFVFALGAMSLGRFVGYNVDNMQAKGVSIFIYLMLAIYSYHNHHAKEYKEGIWVDQNKNKKIEGKEIILLALSLSLDTWIIALPLGFTYGNLFLLALLFGIANFVLLLIGNYLCHIVKRYIPCQMMSFSWVIFVVLALLHS